MSHQLFSSLKRSQIFLLSENEKEENWKNAFHLTITLAQNYNCSFHLIDINQIIDHYLNWKKLLPRVRPYFAHTLQRDPKITYFLGSLGCGFSCASYREINDCVTAVPRLQSNEKIWKDIILSNPFKLNSDMKNCRLLGVKMTTFMNKSELDRIKIHWPDAELLLCVATNKKLYNYEMTISKIAAPIEKVKELLEYAKKLDLNVIGLICCHGTHFKVKKMWKDLPKIASDIVDEMTSIGFDIQIVSLGDGFDFIDHENEEEDWLKFQENLSALNNELDEYFPISRNIQLIAQPGRYFTQKAELFAFKVMGKRIRKIGGEKDFEEEEDVEEGKEEEKSGMDKIVEKIDELEEEEETAVKKDVDELKSEIEVVANNIDEKKEELEKLNEKLKEEQNKMDEFSKDIDKQEEDMEMNKKEIEKKNQEIEAKIAEVDKQNQEIEEEKKVNEEKRIKKEEQSGKKETGEEGEEKKETGEGEEAKKETGEEEEAKKETGEGEEAKKETGEEEEAKKETGEEEEAKKETGEEEEVKKESGEEEETKKETGEEEEVKKEEDKKNKADEEEKKESEEKTEEESGEDENIIKKQEEIKALEDEIGVKKGELVSAQEAVDKAELEISENKLKLEKMKEIVTKLSEEIEELQRTISAMEQEVIDKEKKFEDGEQENLESCPKIVNETQESVTDEIAAAVEDEVAGTGAEPDQCIDEDEKKHIKKARFVPDIKKEEEEPVSRWPHLKERHCVLIIENSQYMSFNFHRGRGKNKPNYWLSIDGDLRNLNLKSPDGDLSATLYGNTCDSLDVICEETVMPEGVSVGDHLIWINRGCYGSCLMSQFNGIKPPKHFHFINKNKLDKFMEMCGMDDVAKLDYRFMSL